MCRIRARLASEMALSPMRNENAPPRERPGTFPSRSGYLGNSRWGCAKFKGRTTTMGSTMDKVKGLANEAAGNVKQAAGKAMNKPGMEAEGIAQERKGEAQQMVGKGKDAVKKVVDKA
jgi:uncharacterized protein YjbJ (UPF0337 family)